MTISKAKRRQGLAFAKVLSDVAAKAPDDELKKKAYRLVNDARMMYGYKWNDKRDEVLRCVGLGASTRDDLMRETPFPRQEIDGILNELVGDQILRVTHIQLNHVGPKVAHYFPVDA